MEWFRLYFDHLAWIEHQFLIGIRDSRKEGSVWGMIRGVGGVRKSIHQSWLAKGLGLGLLCWGFKGVQEEIPRQRPALFKSGQWHFQQDNASVLNYIFVTEFLTKMGIKTVPHRPYSPDFAPCDFCLFPKLRGCRYETIEEMKEAVTKVIDTLTQEDFDGTFQKWLKRHNKCIAAGGVYLEEDQSFIWVLSIKVLIRNKSGKLFNDTRIYTIGLNSRMSSNISDMFIYILPRLHTPNINRSNERKWFGCGVVDEEQSEWIQSLSQEWCSLDVGWKKLTAHRLGSNSSVRKLPLYVFKRGVFWWENKKQPTKNM